MDRVERYREIVRRLIEEYASYKPSHGRIETEAIVDREHDHYEVMHVGWDGVRRVHGSVVHIDIIGGKVWVQYDGTTRPVAEELVAAGIPREEIVLGFHPEDVRHHTGFATR
jgi:XisI protein